MYTSRKELIRRFYDIGSRYYFNIYGEHIHDGYYITGRESRQQAQENLVRYLVEKGRIPTGAKILDIGCGIGGSSIWLAQNLGAATLGINISPIQLEMARKIAGERGVDSQFLLMDAEEMHFDSTFDVIWAVGVCTHLEYQHRFINTATEFLNKNGRFIIFDWMINDAFRDAPDDRIIKSVRQGMLLASLHTMPDYVHWFTEAGCRITCSEDITALSIKTWDDAISCVRQPAIWKLAYQLARKEGKQVFTFLRSLSAMKTAMAKNRLLCGVVVAEKT